MNRFGPHAQSNQIHNWPHAVSLMQPGSWFKFMDDVGMSRDAKNANGSIKVVGRFHRDNMQQFSLDANETRNRARAFIGTWLNESFMEFAPYIDAVEDFNEYWAVSHTPEETASRVLWIQTLLQVWEDDILSDARYDSLARIKWCLGNAAVGNDMPWQVAKAATEADSGPHYIGYHGYVSVVSKDYSPSAIESLSRMKPAYRETFRVGQAPYHIEPFSYDERTISTARIEAARTAVVPGERSPDEFIWGSGRILFADEHHYKPRGFSPKYIITEGGLVRDLNGQAWLQPNDGWGHSQVTDSNMDRYVELMSEVADLYRDWNYHNNDRLEGYVYFTSGDFDWPDFHLDGGELTEIIERTGAFEGTPDYPVPPTPPPPTVFYPVNGLDISHWQGGFDGEISFENGNIFAIMKATDGFVMDMNNQDNPHLDPTFVEFTKEAVLSNHHVGAYHFFQSSRPAAEQAMSFLNAISLVEEQNIPPILDLEGDVIVSIDVFQNMVLEWLNIVEDQTGQVPMLYTNVSFYDRWLSNPKFDRYPLWIANYGGISSRPSLPSRRDTWDIWQWTSKGNGGANGVDSAYVDQNRFNGNVLRFLGKYEENWLAPTPPPLPEPPPANPCQIREQYDRVVHVINPRATERQRQFVFDTVSNNLQTVTFSYDDAGATPCINNTAVLWFLTEQEIPEYEAWFAEFYPNTSLAIVSTVDEYAATNAGSSNLLSLWQKVLLRLRRSS